MATRFTRQTIDAPLLGIVGNRAANDIDQRAWVTADNVVFRNGQVEKTKGWTRYQSDVVGEVNFIQAVRYASGSIGTLIGTNSFLYRFSPSGITQLNTTPFQMVYGQRWQADYLYNKWFLTNQQDGLQVWLGGEPSTGDGIISGDAAFVGVSPLKASSLAQFQNHIMLGNIFSGDQQGEYSISGSSLLDPSVTPFGVEWNATVDPQTTDYIVFEVADDAAPIQTLRRIGSYLAIYKESSIYLTSYNNGTYANQMVSTNRGLLAPAGLADLGDTHIIVSADNLYQFNGSSPVPFGDRVWQKWFVDAVSATNRTLISAFVDQRFREVIFTLPGTNKAVVWNYQYDSFSTRDWPFNAVGYSTNVPEAPTFDQLTGPMDAQGVIGQSGSTAIQAYNLIAGNSDGGLYILDETADTAVTDEIVATLESKDFNFGTSDNFKILGGIDIESPLVTGSPLQVYVATRRSLSEDLTWQGPFEYLQGSRGIDLMIPGIWFRFKFVKTDGAFVLRSYTPRIQMKGRF